MFKKTKFGPIATTKTTREDGSILFKLNQPLEEYPEKIANKLIYWAEETPNKTFIARRKSLAENDWELFTYAETLNKVKSIGLNLNLSGQSTPEMDERLAKTISSLSSNTFN